ncbi:amino acid dehydrogenase [Sphingobacterium faecium NBRC 15299]|uniref:NAD(P)/FAD-dependent oxidoreductase n=1 Tax=Sphingobacterium faecium TaxID=34087 RepID=UPI000D3A8EE3|nr:FAD-dependent oxidoreductase [Sphingobacterium faecium]PTX12593.1 D-amino-acid dehydrogenase [Sphingobacterium faecium]GEM62300.1 amino acid dehydrogenase [Sphingobacterium faecium NBRC 15299]
MSTHNKGKVAIIGAGIAGLSTAYYLLQDGWEVQILEKGDGQDNCSYGNAGMIVPSHFTPLAAPGIVAQGVKWMLYSKSPFYVRPSLNFSLIDWGLKFLKHANEKHVNRNAAAIRDLNLASSRYYDQLAQQEGFDFELRQNGIMMLYKSNHVAHEEIELAEKAQNLGLDVEVFDQAGIQALEPNLRMDTIGGILYKCDGILYPPKLMKTLTDYLLAHGVQFNYQTEVTGFKFSGKKVSEIVTSKGAFHADEVVVTGGAALPALASKLQLKLPLMPGKGYSFMHHTTDNSQMVHAALLLEARVAVTPMNNQIRFSGTMELGPANDKIYTNRVKGIVESIPKYFPDLQVDYPQDIWFGYRPCSPDGLPYLGRTSKYSNVSIAGGGGMMGLSLGPAYGKAITALLSNQPTETDITGFNPDRFQ